MGSPLDLSGLGQRFLSRMSTTQVPVACGASGTFANDGNGLCTLHCSSAHGLSLTPSAGVMPNFFFTVTGSSGEAGGTLIGNIFRILKLPNTTDVVFYSTLTAATVTGASIVPVFFMPFTAMLSNYGGQVGPVDASGVTQPPAALNGGAARLILGANCAWRINYDNTAIVPLDPVTTPSTGTPGTAPAWEDAIAASGKGTGFGGYQECLWANGSAGTTYASVYA